MSRGNDPSRLATKAPHFPATTCKPYNRLCAALQTLDSQCSGLLHSASHRGSHLLAPFGIWHFAFRNVLALAGRRLHRECRGFKSRSGNLLKPVEPST
jgi:hypothetical protein